MLIPGYVTDSIVFYLSQVFWPWLEFIYTVGC